MVTTCNHVHPFKEILHKPTKNQLPIQCYLCLQKNNQTNPLANNIVCFTFSILVKVMLQFLIDFYLKKYINDAIKFTELSKRHI